jgi:long-chain acyl-CoA synthetase
MAVQQATARLWLEKTGCPICEGYGLSETSPSATCNPVDSHRLQRHHRPADAQHRAEACSTTTAIEVPPGTPGEIAIRGPQVMAGYWQRPDETAKVMTADGFFRTGDIGVVDERGYFKIVDRKKDMILVSGFNVYPNEVEDVITQMPGVLECAAVGVPDAKAGEAVKVVIVKKDPALTEADVRSLLRGQPHRLQAAEDRRVPQRPAEDTGGQDPAPRTARMTCRPAPRATPRCGACNPATRCAV